jgi:hypothetical protein
MDSADLPALFAEFLLFDYKNLLTNPARLGPFLSLCKLIAELEEEARHAAIALAMREVPIPGWTLVRKNGNAYVEDAAVLVLLQRCPINSLTSLLPVISHALGNVSEQRYTAFCQAAGITPDPDIVKHAGATALLRQNSNQKEN